MKKKGKCYLEVLLNLFKKDFTDQNSKNKKKDLELKIKIIQNSMNITFKKLQ